MGEKGKMKKGKRIIAVFLMIVLAISLCGCEDTSEMLYGTWETTIDYSAAMEEDLGSGYEDFHQSFEIRMMFEFKEDGTYSMYADEESTKETIDNWINAFVPYSVEVMYKQFEKKGVSREEADAAIQAQYGCSLEEYKWNEIRSEVNPDDYLSESKSDGVFKAKKNKLFLDGEKGYEVFTIEGDTLTIDLPEGAEVEMIDGIEYPLVFTKVVIE